MTSASGSRPGGLFTDSYLAACADILGCIGVVEDPFRQEVTAKYPAAAVRIVRDSLGEEGAQRFLHELIEAHLPPDEPVRERFRSVLRDEHGWVSAWLDHVSAARASLLLRRTDIFRQVGFVAVANRATAHSAFAGVLGLRWLYRHLAEVNRNFNMVTNISYDEDASKAGRTIIAKWNLPVYDDQVRSTFGKLASQVVRFDCELTEGALSAVPVLFGRPPATATHIACQAEGAQRCQILLEWQDVGLLARFLSGLRNLVPSHRRLLSRVGQMEVLIRDARRRLQETHLKELAHSRRLAAAEAEVKVGKAYASAAAHDINNALGPARSGIEEILHLLWEARPAVEGHSGEAEAAEADFARQLGKVVEAELAGIAKTFEKMTGSLSRPEAELLLDRLEFLGRVSRTMREAIPDIYRGINRASDYTSFMSEMAHVDYSEARQLVGLDELLGELVVKYRRLWERQGIELEADLPEGIVVSGWPHVFESAFSNLLDNAAKAVQESEEKRVRVSLGREDERCVVTVEDTGPGIPEELREKVFELGYTTHPADGKGFGLAYVRNYVTLLGGDVSVQDRPEGGTAFVVQIPVSQTAQDSAQ